MKWVVHLQDLVVASRNDKRGRSRWLVMLCLKQRQTEIVEWVVTSLAEVLTDEWGKCGVDSNVVAKY